MGPLPRAVLQADGINFLDLLLSGRAHYRVVIPIRQSLLRSLVLQLIHLAMKIRVVRNLVLRSLDLQ
jgi:hypothetical protein